MAPYSGGCTGRRSGASIANAQHVVQALPPNSPNEALRIRILPGTPRGREDCLYRQVRNAALKHLVLHPIAVSEGIPGR